MEKELTKQLNWYYYGMMVLTLISATLGYLLTKQWNLIVPIEVMDELGHPNSIAQVIQYVVIVDALFFIPMGLYGFKRRVDKIRRIEDETEKYAKYKKEAIIRIILVSNTMVLGMFAFYLLNGYQSMLWVSAIAAIGWYFTKPTPRKIQLELLPPDVETY
ncbi:MAG: hypothetical protein MJZ84_07760 [Paludibacteraceae bacterium]|nr:hypothetical protein [Paludibacteraceae bacterium]